MNLIKNLEALLFASGNEGLNAKEIASLLEIPKNNVNDIIEKYNQKLNNDQSALTIKKFGEKYKLTTREELNHLLSHFVENKPNKLSQSSLETLAITAYKGPITRIEIEEIRGVDCNFVISKLTSLNLIEEVGRANTPGSPILYNVTQDFMDTFKIESLNDLPKLEDFKDPDLDGANIFKTKYIESDANG